MKIEKGVIWVILPKRFCFDYFSALLDLTPKLSLTEEEIKMRAQSLTDTDLQDKQAGNNDNSLTARTAIIDPDKEIL